MSNVPPGPPGGFPPPPPPGGGYPPPPGGGGFPPPPGGGGFPPPPAGGGFPPPGGGYPPPGGGGFPPPGGGFGSGPGGPPGVPGPLAEWQDRLIAGLIDWVGPFLISGVVGFVLSAALSFNSSLYFNPGSLIAGLAALGWILYNGYLAGETGQSIGMKQSGLRLVGEQTGQPVGGSQGLVRNLMFAGYWLCGCLFPLIVVDALFPLWDAKKQTLRDKIAKAVVIKVG